MWRQSQMYIKDITFPKDALSIGTLGTQAQLRPQYVLTRRIHSFMTKDKRIWGDDSEIFNPDRFLSPPNPGEPARPDPTSLIFGFGRR